MTKCQHEGLFGIRNLRKTFQIRSSSLKGVKLCQLGWNLHILSLLMLNTLNSRFVILKILEFNFAKNSNFDLFCSNRCRLHSTRCRLYLSNGRTSIFTCVSVSFSDLESSNRLPTERYLLLWNSDSSLFTCSGVKAVRGLFLPSDVDSEKISLVILLKKWTFEPKTANFLVKNYLVISFQSNHLFHIHLLNCCLILLIPSDSLVPELNLNSRYYQSGSILSKPV